MCAGNAYFPGVSGNRTLFGADFQTMINIGVSTGVLPVTGQPLPWISLGGTSLLFTSVAFGCVLSVSHQNQINRQAQKPPVQVALPDEDFDMNKKYEN